MNMDLSPTQLSELEALAIQAAQRAAAMIQTRVRQDLEVLHKEGGSSVASQVVTEVDLESQRLILETLEDSIRRYELGLLTEESPDDASRHQRKHFWCIDPMDGTLAFTKQSPGYSVSIALVARDGTPSIGVVCDPVSGTIHHSIRGQGARRNGEPWEPQSHASNDKLSLFIDHSFIATASRPEFRERLEALAKNRGCHEIDIIDHQGAVLNACSVATNAPALYFKPPKPEPGGGSLWDFAATACIFTELGLPASDFHGQPLNLNPEGSTFMNHRGVLYASDLQLAAGAHELKQP
ncbi:MAG: inositol monophosphatase family protein [Akkermansiaceae bacterium]|nr:inositol monophosphatase family protein [Akkermansiaceae bacterium]